MDANIVMPATLIDDVDSMPLVARFATIQYDLEMLTAIAPTNTGIFSEGTSPQTFSSTTSYGKDNDRDDTGKD
ncbi:MAG: hypothetical protein KA765_07700 [Thermoflexales bacterium]|nr:hypothetical protein [Thermoflexales bacterium]